MATNCNFFFLLLFISHTFVSLSLTPFASLYTTLHRYDLVHDDDLLILHAIKTHFWERDQPDVEVYLRRRTIEGGWTWLVANVVSYIDSPVPGIVIHEAIVRNIDMATLINRITRIASLLLRAVESSIGVSTGLYGVDFAATESPEMGTEGGKRRTALDPVVSAAAAVPAGGWGADIQAMLSETVKSNRADLSDTENPLWELIEAADNAMAEGQSDKYTSYRNKTSNDHLHCLKTGASLDLSKIILSEGEIKLVMLVLTGRLQVKDMKPLIYLTLNSPEMDLVATADEYYHLTEQLRGNAHMQSPSGVPSFLLNPPPIAMINLSYTQIGNNGMEILSESIYAGNTSLKSLDLSFCNISSQGLLSLCHGLRTRGARGLPSLQALALTGNSIELDVAKQLGRALSAYHYQVVAKKSSWEDMNQPMQDRSLNRRSSSFVSSYPDGLRLLHLGCTSISSRSLIEILTGLGPTCPLEELKINSNGMGTTGAATLVAFLNGKSPENGNQPVLPRLNRIDVSYNNLGDLGTTKLIRAISKRAKIDVKEASLSGNEIGSSCIERIMNIFLLHKLKTLNLDNNCIGDQGCQLVAASLPSIPSLTRLNLAFNDIGSRGMATLMRALVGCESMTSLGLSGIAMRISGAIAMGFTLAQHPRLSTLELHNCCLSQVAQCHIVAGIISNRWVPMKVIHGFRVGPPMVAIGALEVAAQHMTNEECFRLRRDIQMKTLLQWMESNRNTSADNNDPNLFHNVATHGANDASGAPSQSTYLRMLDWLGRIPFDESELIDLQRYFYDTSYSDGDQRSKNNLKHRGDILAALASEVVEEILESEPVVYSFSNDSIGLDLSKLDDGSIVENTKVVRNCSRPVLLAKSGEGAIRTSADLALMSGPSNEVHTSSTLSVVASNALSSDLSKGIPKNIIAPRSSMSTLSLGVGKSDSHSRGSRSSNSIDSFNQFDNIQHKARITMFPHFAAKLDNLKAVAQDMMDRESDPEQQDIVAQQFAEASLTILRQLRYHCMESGLDGWRQGKLRRKILVVDDSVVTRKLVTRAFEKANFIVDTAEDGVMGVNKMKESIYDIAFMDIDMPVMNGFDATKAFRMWEDAVRPGARQPICALTAAHVDDFDKCELMKFKDAGLDVMESKPCNISRLFKVVDDVAPMFSDLSINASQYDSNVGS